MKPEQYTVVFTNYAVQQVWALGYGEAIIVAQANQILKGEGYNVYFVKDDENRVVFSNRAVKQEG